MLPILNSIARFFFDKHRTLSFESKILAAISVLGLIRTIFGLYQLWINNAPAPFVTQTILATVFFFVALIVALHGKYTSQTAMIFSICLLVLLTQNWVTAGGLEGYSEYNLMSMLIIFAAINRGKFLLAMASIVWLTLFTLVIIWYQFPQLLNFENIYPTTRIYNYQFVVGIVTILLVYLSSQYANNKEQTTIEGEKVFKKIKELETQNDKIEKEKTELQRISTLLENRVITRTMELTRSNEALAEYLKLSSEEIAPLVLEVTQTIKNITGNMNESEGFEWLKISAADLRKAYEEVYEK